MMSGRDLEGSGSFRSGVVPCICSSLAKLGRHSPEMRFRYTSPLYAECIHLRRNPNAFPVHQPSVCGMYTLTAKPECFSGTAALCVAECVHLQRNLNAFPLQHPSIVRNVCTYSEIPMCCRYSSHL